MKNSSRNLGVCVVGAGDISNYFLKSWKKIKGVDLISIADIVEERAINTTHEYGIKSWYRDYKKAVDLDNVDIVTVCIPTYLHPEISIFAANSRKHVLCVKPIALSLEEADEMIETTRKNRVKFCVGFMRRFSHGAEILKRLLEKGGVGRPVLYSVNHTRPIRPKRFMHDKKNCGGPIIDMCCHYFDLWRAIFGSEPVRVMAQGLIFGKDKKELKDIKALAYDTASLIVTFASGDIGTINITWGFPSGIVLPGREEEVWGPEGMISGLKFNTKKIVIRRDIGENNCEKETTIKIESTFQDPFDLLVEHFVQTIREDKPLSVTGEDGRKALEISLAVLKSIETGKAVDL